MAALIILDLSDGRGPSFAIFSSFWRVSSGRARVITSIFIHHQAIVFYMCGSLINPVGN